MNSKYVEMMEVILSVIIGIGLAASVGFRIFVPLLVLSISAHYGVIPLNENWNWVGSNTALIVFSIATLLESLAYFIPWFDNLLDVISAPIAAVAGTLVVIATINEMDPVLSWSLAIIAGGGTATAIKGMTGSSRAVSTATTGGIANPIFSTFEVISSTVLSILSIFLPILAIIIVVVLFLFMRIVYKKVFKKKVAADILDH